VDGGGCDCRASGVMKARLYLDLASPYAYLAAERVGSLFPGGVDFQPVLLGAIFKLRGWGSWAATAQREAGMEEIETRARRYGLPPVAWPAEWPASSLAADRAALWAGRRGVGERFILELYRREFVRGEDVSDPQVLASVAVEIGLDGGDLLESIQTPDIKAALRRATDEAWTRGVRGVPSLALGGRVFYGDDALDEAAASV
jgi:2-hydroxychromene-2-carboxylate isomerase